MRRHHWLLAAVVLLALFVWTQRPDNGALRPSGELPMPAAEAPTSPPASAPATPAPVATRDAPTATVASAPAPSATARYPDFLPPEAHAVLDAIERGGPYAYARDGVTFQNREGRLPRQPRGYYREFTVPTPGESDRGARRIVTGGTPPRAYWYTADHYRSFRAFAPTAADPPPARAR